MNAIDLPSSIYPPSEQDYGFLSDNMFPMAQADGEIEQQSVGSYIPFSDGLDLSTYDESQLLSDFSGSAATWDGTPMSVAYDMSGIQSAQDEACR
jgi:hypothetical protein